jgi:hypothetical protein
VSICIHGHDTSKTGRDADGHCSECRRSTHKARRDRTKRAWAEANPGRMGELKKLSRKRNPETQSVRTWRHQLRASGWQPERYHWQVMAQGCKCAICGEIPVGKLHADHCHASGAPRALLCGDCNRGLGLFRDRPELLLAGGKYLRKFQLADPE